MKIQIGLLGVAILTWGLLISRLPAQSTKSVQDNLNLNLDGVVTDELGKPLAGATVDVIHREIGQFPTEGQAPIKVIKSFTSGVDGRFHLDISLPSDAGRGEYLLRGVKEDRGYSVLGIEQGKSLRFFDDTRQTWEAEPWIILFPTRTIRGIVVNEQNHPVANCQVYLGIADAAHSGPDGKFEIPHVRAFGDSMLLNLASVEFFHPDYVECTIRIPFDQSQINVEPDGNWKVVLQRGVLVSGTMKDQATGQPLAGTGVRCFAQSDAMDGFNATTCADDKGHYSIHMPAAASVSFMPFANDDASNPNRMFAPTKSMTEDSLQGAGDSVTKDFTFVKGQAILGKLKVDGATDCSNLYISVSKGSGANSDNLPGAECKPDGTFRIGPLVPGTYTLTAMRTAQKISEPLDVDVVRGQDAADVILPVNLSALPDAVAKLHGIVLNPDGSPAVLAAVRFQPNNFDQRQKTIFTGLDGSFEIAEIDPSADQTLWVSSADRSNAATVVIASGNEASTPTTVQLSPTAQISGKIYDENNQPMANVVVVLCVMVRYRQSAACPSMVSTLSDAQGNYTLRGFQPPKSSHDLKLEAQVHRRPNRRVDEKMHNIGDDLQSGKPLTGYNFRITQSASSVKIEPERDQ